MDIEVEAAKRLSYARGYFELGMYREAFAEVRRHARLARINREIALFALECCKRIGDWNQLSGFSEYVGRRYSCAMPEALIYQSKAELKRCNVGFALSLLDEGIRHRPNSSLLWYEMARLFCLIRCFDLAGRAMTNVARLDPAMAETAAADPDFEDFLEGNF